MLALASSAASQGNLISSDSTVIIDIAGCDIMVSANLRQRSVMEILPYV